MGQEAALVYLLELCMKKKSLNSATIATWCQQSVASYFEIPTCLKI